MDSFWLDYDPKGNFWRVRPKNGLVVLIRLLGNAEIKRTCHSGSVSRGSVDRLTCFLMSTRTKNIDLDKFHVNLFYDAIS